MDPNLPKHIMASLAEYFRPKVSALGIQYFVEGIDLVTEDTFQNDSIVLRMNGPVLHEGSNNFEWYKIEVQLLLTDLIQDSETSAYTIYEWAGTIQKALQDPISIFEFAGDPQDDVLLGCLEPDKSVRNNIRTVNYQIVDRDLPIRQMSVHGVFILCLNN